MCREHFPDALFRLVELAAVQLVERQAVHVEVEQRRLDVDRVQVLGHEGDPGSLLDDELPLLAHAAGRPVVEAVELLAADADDHCPGGVVVGRRLVPAQRGIDVEGEAVIGIFGDAVEAGLELAAGGRRRIVRRREQILPRGQPREPPLDALQAVAAYTLARLDRPYVGHGGLNLTLPLCGSVHGGLPGSKLSPYSTLRRAQPWL